MALAVPVVNLTATTPDKAPSAAPYKVSHDASKDDLTYSWTIDMPEPLRYWQERVGGTTRKNGTVVKRLGNVCGMDCRCGGPGVRPLGYAGPDYLSLPVQEGFESGAMVTAWSALNGGSGTPGTGDAARGSRSMRVTSAGGAANMGIISDLATVIPTPNPGGNNAITFWAKSVSGATTLTIQAERYDNTNTFVSAGNTYTFFCDTTWQKFSLQFFVSQVAATRLRLSLKNNFSTAAFVADFDELKLWGMADLVTVPQQLVRASSSIDIDGYILGGDGDTVRFGVDALCDGAGWSA